MSTKMLRVNAEWRGCLIRFAIKSPLTQIDTFLLLFWGVQGFRECVSKFQRSTDTNLSAVQVYEYVAHELVSGGQLPFSIL